MQRGYMELREAIIESQEAKEITPALVLAVQEMAKLRMRPGLAADASQDVLVKLIHYLPSIRPNESLAFVGTLLHNWWCQACRRWKSERKRLRGNMAEQLAAVSCDRRGFERGRAEVILLAGSVPPFPLGLY